MFLKCFTVTVISQIVIINSVLSASIRNSTSDNLSTTSTTQKSSIIQHANSKNFIPPQTITITLGTTFKPNLIEKEITEKTAPKKIMRKKKAATAATTDETPNDKLENAIKEKFAQAQNRIQDVFNSTKERIQAQSKKLQQEMNGSKTETNSGETEMKAASQEVTSETKKDKKEGSGSNAKSADTIPALTFPASSVAAAPMPTLPSIDESIKPITGAGIETISFNKTVDLPIINKPNDKQNVFVVGDKGNATFSRTLNSLSVEAHNIL